MFRLYLQDAPNDCGAACLASVLRHHGLTITPVDLAGRMTFSRAGTSSSELQRVALELGLESRLIALPLDQFHRLSDPAIAYVESASQGLSHNVVITRVAGDRVWVADPARGSYRTTLAGFAERYQGLMLILRPTEGFERGVLSRSYGARFMAFAAAWRWQIALSLALGVVISALGFLLIWLGKLFVDETLAEATIEGIQLFALAYFGAKLLNAVIAGLNEVYGVTIRNAVGRMLSTRFFIHTLDLEKHDLDTRHAGDYMHTYSRIETLTTGIADYFSRFVLTVVGVVVKAGFLIWLYDPFLVAIILLVLALEAAVGFLLAPKTAEHANNQVLIFSEITSAILGSLADIRVVRIFGGTDWLANRYRDLLAKRLVLTRKLANLEVAGRGLADCLSICADAAIYLICGLRIMEGSYTVGDFLVFFAFATGLMAEARQFPQLILSFQAQLRAFAGVQSVFELRRERACGEAPSKAPLRIELREVSFAYTAGRPVLEDIDLTLEPGRTTALVGESGSGKTTLMNLVMGFYAPSKGEILVNGKNLSELDLARYRERISAVFQDTTLFNRSLGANITLGHPAVDERLVRDRAEDLGVMPLLDRQPLGLRQPLYPGVVSGGQTQQIGILRAVCKPFDLLIMDEATSQVDSRGEARLNEGLAQLSGTGQARAIIAHRLSTVKAADQIVVMKAGRIVERGTHETLIAKKGAYLDLIQRQYEVNLTPNGRPGGGS